MYVAYKLCCWPVLTLLAPRKTNSPIERLCLFPVVSPELPLICSVALHPHQGPSGQDLLIYWSVKCQYILTTKGMPLHIQLCGRFYLNQSPRSLNTQAVYETQSFTLQLPNVQIKDKKKVCSTRRSRIRCSHMILVILFVAPHPVF